MSIPSSSPARRRRRARAPSPPAMPLHNVTDLLQSLYFQDGRTTTTDTIGVDNGSAFATTTISDEVNISYRRMNSHSRLLSTQIHAQIFRTTHADTCGTSKASASPGLPNTTVHLGSEHMCSSISTTLMSTSRSWKPRLRCSNRPRCLRYTRFKLILLSCAVTDPWSRRILMQTLRTASGDCGLRSNAF